MDRVHALGRSLLSVLVPPLCVACREPDLSGACLCRDCRRHLVSIGENACRRCGAPLARPVPACPECARRSLAFDRAWSAFAYEGVARQAVSALKRRGNVAAARAMALELAIRAPAGLLAGVLVPVPAHPSRRREQGFNHAETLARALGRAAGLRVGPVLRRSRTAERQTGQARSSRLAAPRESVRAGGPVPSRAVLVDDVYTTGATLDDCARVLRAGGATEVVALTFARAVRS